MKRPGKTIILNKVYGRAKGLVCSPINEIEDINLEPLTIHRIMKQIQVELLKPVEFHGMFNLKVYAPGIHSLDRDLARLLVRVHSARYLHPHRPVPAPKASRP